uniref:Uncharacterized protein MANES_13G016400 n=1 Tax=Rhizophora mucronata TaxID=61149 RepID=A0A2P2JE94_RHIMU
MPQVNDKKVSKFSPTGWLGHQLKGSFLVGGLSEVKGSFTHENMLLLANFSLYIILTELSALCFSL